MFWQFGEQVLQRKYTEDIKNLLRSLYTFPVTFGQSANSTGKTFAAGDAAIAWFKIFGEAKVFTFAAPPEDNLKKLLWGQIGSVVEKFPHLFVDDKVSLASLDIKRASEEFVTGVTIPNQGTVEMRKGRFSGKHSPHLLFIGDESDAVPPEVFDAIETCMTGGHHRLLLNFNPRAATGKIYDMQVKKRGKTVVLGAFTHDNVVTGEDIIPGAVTREDTVRRIVEWSRPVMPNEHFEETETFEVPAYLIGYRATSHEGELYPPLPGGTRVVTENELFHVVLAKYPNRSSSQLISRGAIDAARTRWDLYVSLNGQLPPQNVRPVMGQDVGEMGTDPSVNCLRYGGWVPPMESWVGKRTDETAEMAIAIYRKTAPVYCNVDGTGVGAGVWPPMNAAGCKAYRVMASASPPNGGVVEGVGTFDRMRDWLWWECKNWLEAKNSVAMLPPDGELIEELEKATYAIDNGKILVLKKKIMRELLHRSPDKADALCLTFAPEAVEQVGTNVATLQVINYAY